MNKYITAAERKKLSRPVYPLPPTVQRALKRYQLEARYKARPAYQKNDYIGWINRAKRPETQQKRLEQMLTELKDGARYMGMKQTPRS